MLRMTGLAGVIAAAVMGLAAPAEAQRNDCQDYADKMEAMERARDALGPLPEDQMRSAHLSWCGGAPTHHPRIHFERQIHDFHAFARSISIRHLTSDVRCDSYAVASDAFETALEALGCPIQAFTTDEHRNWCGAGNQENAVVHLTHRREALLGCIARFDYRGPGGGGRDFSSRGDGAPVQMSTREVRPARAAHSVYAAPEGSYQQSCRGAAVEEGTLFAECRDRAGRYRRTSLFLGAYSGPISNCDGELRRAAAC